MKTAIITANLGNFDPPARWATQSIPVDIHRFTDENFKPRPNSMTPRLQARIVKCFGWQLRPGYDAYIWLDASVAPQHPDSAKWFLEQLGNGDAAFFLHPDRRTIREEADFIRGKILEGNKYLSSRYAGEFLDEQVEAVSQHGYTDDTLYATTAFAYRNTGRVRAALKEWWFHISRYHSVDQLAAPYVLWQHGVRVSRIAENYLRIPYLTYTRNRRAA